MPARSLEETELERFPGLGWSEVAPRIQPAVRRSLERVLETQDGASLSR
jgi:hypothetical protein